MKKINATYFAHPLKPNTPEPIEVAGELIAETELEQREQIIYDLLTRAEKGTLVFDREGVKFFDTKDCSVVFEIFTDTKDTADRFTQIVCFAEYEGITEDFVESLITDLKRYSERISRPIPEKHYNTLKQAFEVLKNRKKKRFAIFLIAVLITIFGIFAISFLL